MKTPQAALKAFKNSGKLTERIEAAHRIQAQRYNEAAETGRLVDANDPYCSIWGNDWPVCKGCPFGPGCELFYRWCGEGPEIKRVIAIQIAGIACEQ